MTEHRGGLPERLAEPSTREEQRVELRHLPAGATDGQKQPRRDLLGRRREFSAMGTAVFQGRGEAVADHRPTHEGAMSDDWSHGGGGSAPAVREHEGVPATAHGRGG